jgi:hypothetical protein
MARGTQTYAIRLAVEGGGQVKAELVSVGQSGEQSPRLGERRGYDVAALSELLPAAEAGLIEALRSDRVSGGGP